MPYFDGAAGRVHYRAWTVDEPRAAIVFLHGFGEHSGLYDRLAGHLGRQAIDLWAVDEIGHGLSEGERGLVGSVDALEANARTLSEPPGWNSQLEGDGLSLDPHDLSRDEWYLGALADDPLAFTESKGGPIDALPPAWDELATSFARVRLPVLFVHGAEDPVAPIEGSRRWAAELPSARLHEVPEGRHDILNDLAHAEVADAIARFALAVPATV